MKLDLARIWYQPRLHFFSIVLLPFSWLFRLVVFVRRLLYRYGMLQRYHFKTMIIVVGNITVGGTGKTPCVIALVKLLQKHGYNPGIVSRGVGGKKHSKPYWVKEGDAVDRVGDEAILLKQNTSCPMVICSNRAAAVRALLADTQCNIVISDDGLQHYRLDRDIEIMMVDGERGFGNQQLLPAGPLRESVSRSQSVDFIIYTCLSKTANTDEFNLELEPLEFVSLQNPAYKIDWQAFTRKKVHAVAGIGHTQRFFNSLTRGGFEIIPHVFPDHHLYQAFELDFADEFDVIMTEKDAVKCKSFTNKRCWYLRVNAKLNEGLSEKMLNTIRQMEIKNDDYANEIANRISDFTHDV